MTHYTILFRYPSLLAKLEVDTVTPMTKELLIERLNLDINLITDVIIHEK